MRSATAEEHARVVAAMARHGVRMRRVLVRPTADINATAPLWGRMAVTEGLLAAPEWRRRAVMAHEAGHVRLRHTAWCVVAAAAVEMALAAARYALAPVVLASPWAYAASMVAVGAAEAGVWAGVCAVMRHQEVAADRWAVGPGGITAAVYLRHLAALPEVEVHGLWGRMLVTHPTPVERARALGFGARSTLTAGGGEDDSGEVAGGLWGGGPAGGDGVDALAVPGGAPARLRERGGYGDGMQQWHRGPERGLRGDGCGA